jgi:hypothetical protein
MLTYAKTHSYPMWKLQNGTSKDETGSPLWYLQNHVSPSNQFKCFKCALQWNICFSNVVEGSMGQQFECWNISSHKTLYHMVLRATFVALMCPLTEVQLGLYHWGNLRHEQWVVSSNTWVVSDNMWAMKPNLGNVHGLGVLNLYLELLKW